MTKLIAHLVVAGLVVGANTVLAQNSSSDKDNARPHAPAERDCTKLSGKERDQCIQATPAGPVDTETGQGNKAKSDIAKERDAAKAESQAAKDIPVQSQDTVGHPNAVKPTGEGQPLAEPGRKDTSGSQSR